MELGYDEAFDFVSIERESIVVCCDQVIEEAKHLKSTTTQRAQDVEGLLSELDEANLAESQQKTALEDQSLVGLSTICSVDRSRQTAAQLAYDEEQQAISVSQHCWETSRVCCFRVDKLICSISAIMHVPVVTVTVDMHMVSCARWLFFHVNALESV